MTNPLDTIEKALQEFIDHEVNYMTINNLGNPEEQHRVIYGREALAALRQLKAVDVIRSSGPASSPLIRRTEDVDGNRVVIVAEWFYDEIFTQDHLASRGLIRVEDAENKREALAEFDRGIAYFNETYGTDRCDPLWSIRQIKTIRTALGGKDELR